MASQSPTTESGATGATGASDEKQDYLTGWAALTRLMNEGLSWSGNERNVCYLNLGDGRFVDASFVSGLDFADDGRAAATVDWDGDGDLDLWLRNRTGPQLRFMRNDLPSGPFVALRLVGVESNRDAIGARVQLTSDGRTLWRTVTAGDGYLSQSSRWLPFGLADATRVDEVVVHWPGGAAETVTGIEVGRRHVVTQGRGRAKAVEPRGLRLAAAAPPEAPVARLSPVLLKEPLGMPPGISGLLPGGSGRRARLITLWAHWCEPCLEELDELSRGYDALREGGIEVVALSVDPPEDIPLADRLFSERILPNFPGEPFARRTASPEVLETIDALLSHVLGRHDDLLLPTSLLVDPVGQLQLVYLGPLSTERLLDDARRWALSPPIDASRRSLYPGRWYFRTPRDLAGLAADLKTRGREEDARFYESLLRMRSRVRSGGR